MSEPNSPPAPGSAASRMLSQVLSRVAQARRRGVNLADLERLIPGLTRTDLRHFLRLLHDAEDVRQDARSGETHWYLRGVPSLEIRCRKRCYPTRQAALLALVSTDHSARIGSRRFETRLYHCVSCSGWHLTSQQIR